LEQALSKVLSAGANGAVVTLYFGEETVRGTMTRSQQEFFQKNPIFWTAKSDPEGHAVTSGLAAMDAHNTGILELRADPTARSDIF